MPIIGKVSNLNYLRWRKRLKVCICILNRIILQLVLLLLWVAVLEWDPFDLKKWGSNHCLLKIIGQRELHWTKTWIYIGSKYTAKLKQIPHLHIFASVCQRAQIDFTHLLPIAMVVNATFVWVSLLCNRIVQLWIFYAFAHGANADANVLLWGPFTWGKLMCRLAFLHNVCFRCKNTQTYYYRQAYKALQMCSKAKIWSVYLGQQTWSNS